MSNLYQDAILDAKALRASAMANAKAALEEAFEPKIQEMMRLKLSEEFDSLEEDDVNPADIADTEIEDESVSPVGMEENMDINEAELEEILAELEELSKEDQSPLKEAEEAEEADEDEDSKEDAIEDDAEEADEDSEEIGDETKIIDITLGDLKKVLQSVNADKSDMSMDMGSDQADADAEAESEISLDEILAELEMEEGMEELGGYDLSLVHEPDTQGSAQGFDGSKIFEKKKAKYSGYSEKHNAKKEKVDAKDGGDLDDTAYNKLAEETELEEAKATIETLRQNLQEVNLLNAKYLYMNKLFKSKSLTESQKVKVINALDRASNVAEVKNTYETLKESFSETKKTQLKESIGFASQAAGMAPKGNIVDADPFINRWQKLAGISKRK
jgi:hypothetical protein